MMSMWALLPSPRPTVSSLTVVIVAQESAWKFLTTGWAYGVVMMCLTARMPAHVKLKSQKRLLK